MPNRDQPTSPSRACVLSYEFEGKEGSLVATSAPVVIGRANDSDLVIAHDSVSRHHAKIIPSPQGWEVIDLQSKNGIKLNTFRVEREWLRSGDCIDIGAVRVYVELGEAPSEAAPARVIFEEDAKQRRGLRTEMIDMSHLEVLFGSSQAGLHDAPDFDSAAEWPRPSGSDAGSQGTKEPGGLLHLFSGAAEALLTSQSLDETLDRILSFIFSSVPAERGVICLYDEEHDVITPKVMRTLDGVPDEAIAISNRIARSAIDEKSALLVQDPMMDGRFGGAESIIMMQIHSAMCAPLYRAGRVVGFIYVDRRSPEHHFETTHLQALSALAVLSAVAVEQAALREDLEREQEIRNRLARYSSTAVVNRILHAESNIARDMVSDEAEVSVLFADLTDFTSLAENLRPSEVIRLLNQVFERLAGAVFDYEGTLDKFSGDGMMAFFGAPLVQPDHAERAVKAALRMQALLADINAHAHNRRFVSMRIGINSGPVVVGDIGSTQRRDYTVIGDVVNIASRLESSVAQPGQVVIGPRTYRQIASLFSCQELPDVRLKGRIRTVRPYLVLGRQHSARVG